MYPVQGVLSSPAPAKADDFSLGLRLNQRLVAEVLQIAADHVVLGLEGVPVVARLTSADQSAALAERRTAQFTVRGFSEQGLILQLTPAAGSGAAAPAPELLPALLQQAGQPVDAPHLLMAQALVDQGLPVTAELMDELAQALAGLGHWDAADARAAAGLKSAGLPLSAGALQLMASAPADLGAALRELQRLVPALAEAALPPAAAEAVRQAGRLADRLGLDLAASPAHLAAQLQNLIAQLGESVEHGLAQTPDPASPAGTLLALAELRGQLAQAGADHPALTALLRSLDQVLDGARLEQLRNLAPDHPPADGRWLNLNLPVNPPAEPGVRLRVAYRPDALEGVIDARHTRLTLFFPVDASAAVQVDLLVVDRQIGAWVTATNDSLRQAAEAELPDLQQGLAGLGFNLKTARCEVGSPSAASEAARPARPAHPHRVNLEI